MVVTVVDKLDHSSQGIDNRVNMLIITCSRNIVDGDVVAIPVFDLDGPEEGGLGWKSLIFHGCSVAIHQNQALIVELYGCAVIGVKNRAIARVGSDRHGVLRTVAFREDKLGVIGVILHKSEVKAETVTRHVAIS